MLPKIPYQLPLGAAALLTSFWGIFATTSFALVEPQCECVSATGKPATKQETKAPFGGCIPHSTCQSVSGTSQSVSANRCTCTLTTGGECSKECHVAPVGCSESALASGALCRSTFSVFNQKGCAVQTGTDGRKECVPTYDGQKLGTLSCENQLQQGQPGIYVTDRSVVAEDLSNKKRYCAGNCVTKRLVPDPNNSLKCVPTDVATEVFTPRYIGANER